MMLREVRHRRLTIRRLSNPRSPMWQSFKGQNNREMAGDREVGSENGKRA